MAASERELKLSPRGIVKLDERLEGADALLKVIGAMIVRDARAAFNDQKFGDFVWPQKYPNQEGDPDFISVAGAVQDFAEGEISPRPETFEPTPALFRTGALQNSPAFQVGPDYVEIGSAVPYATLHQTGGWSEIPVTEDMKESIDTWLSDQTERGKPGPNEKYRRKLDFLLMPDFTTLETQVNQRPFLGITSRRSDILREMLQDYMAEES